MAVAPLPMVQMQLAFAIGLIGIYVGWRGTIARMTGFYDLSGAVKTLMFGLVAGVFAASAIDGAGNVPFLRAVRPRERPEMTTVFSSYRDAARLTIPGLFAVVLNVFALPAVFVTSGLIMLVMAAYARHIPRRL